MTEMEISMIRALAAIDDALGMPQDGCNSTDKTITAIKLLHAVHVDDEKHIANLEQQLAAAQAEIAELKRVPDNCIRDMVDRFLGWKIPADFYPDCGVKFEPTELQKTGVHSWPVGTNLFHAKQAEEMLGYVAARVVAKNIMLGHEVKTLQETLASHEATIKVLREALNLAYESTNYSMPENMWLMKARAALALPAPNEHLRAFGMEVANRMLQEGWDGKAVATERIVNEVIGGKE